MGKKNNPPPFDPTKVVPVTPTLSIRPIDISRVSAHLYDVVLDESKVTLDTTDNNIITVAQGLSTQESESLVAHITSILNGNN